jgi:2-C-methyl-D-erythritol 4-phosphate cytidylyltransferase
MYKIASSMMLKIWKKINRIREEGYLCLHDGVRNLFTASIMESSMEVLQKSKNQLTYDPVVPTTGYMFKGNEISMSRWLLQSHVLCSTIHNSNEMGKT